MGVPPHIANLKSDGSATEVEASRYRLIFPALAALATGLLLWIAYPPVDSNDMVWFALVPLILLARRQAPCGF